ncbi:2-oxoacid:acceptor oxidoreductase subunit alpha [Blastochloris viridis]|uniref:2-oxoglutarate oxidoreductase n=1 Tax=Blastochloris viridis TaxID=1079 RepID=A0A0H5B8G3_BLAVI|nr:2-oxoacid:acceptor oxidoreductase subunit alpha [Blastochloris viridis]ALK08254.1 2-oxoglutarate oxidoreductase subunit KorA [Blastochloris viridis]BAR98480.1 2-oxoglutarate oxidoreductase [Blastochloris viridis]CUU44176.1 Pyruvate synthase subunit porA [Blastochloris viridis]
MSSSLQSLQGNKACALAAVAAGCRFFAGYPITPSSEIAEKLSRELPRVDGVFIQMEDEIASIAAVIGASLGGAKAMTATSGPGFSLMQENLGFAAMTEVPCVIVNVMRGGPSTGMPTKPAQGDLMQARWGTHGDHPIIVVAPASVQEVYTETIRAFNLAEEFRVPVIVTYDQIIAHLVESVELPRRGEIKIVDRKWADGTEHDFKPYAETDDLIPLMARPGDGHRLHVTGLTHLPDGFPTQKPDLASKALTRLLDKIERHRARIDKVELIETADAEVVIVAVGIAARAARRAVETLRSEGIKAGLVRPVTLWPFPEEALRTAAANARLVLVPEMNLGQLVLEVERVLGRGVRVAGLNRVDGEPIPPAAMVSKIRELVAQ